MLLRGVDTTGHFDDEPARRRVVRDRAWRLGGRSELARQLIFETAASAQ